MAKLIITVDVTIITGPLMVHNSDTSALNRIEGEPLEQMLSDAEPGKIGFEVVTANDDTEITFVFDRSSGKKGSLIEVVPQTNLKGLTVKICGQFDSKLRTGVISRLQSYGSDLDLRIRALTYNGGYWSGFAAYVEDIDPFSKWSSYSQSMPRIKDFLLK